MLTALNQLIQAKPLSVAQCKAAVEALLTGTNPSQAAALLALLQAKGVTANELAAFANCLRGHMQALQLNKPAIDIVGTGGDGMNTVNISSAAALVVASCGVPVLKHGNRAASSKSGSADVLAALGINIHLTPMQVQDCLAKYNFGFCFAPDYHPALKAVKAVRQALKIPTIFNLLGPLLNPAAVPYYLLGVANPRYLEIVAKALLKLNVQRALVVHANGMDELNCLGPAIAIEVTPNGCQPLTLDPGEYGFSTCTLADLQGGDAATNALLLTRVFSGEASPLADTIVFNAGVALHIYGKADSFASGIVMAKEQLKSGEVIKLIKNLRNYSKELLGVKHA
ncbi:MAG: anthranilate phosphoribosyltransferase [Gammaproteobacteria bacterium]|nr:anthranilate phosphoribosyltransferase [Gammaproteobacteria bacterium]